MANKWCTLRSKAHSPFFGYIYNQATASKNPQTNCQMIRNFLYVSFSRLRPIISLHSTSTMWKALKSSRESGWRLAMLINCLLRFWCRHSAVEFLMPLSVTRAKRVMGVAVPRSTGRDGCIEIQQVPSRNARWFEGEQWTMAMFVHQCCSQVVRFRALLTSCKSTCFFYHVFSRMLDTPFNQLPVMDHSRRCPAFRCACVMPQNMGQMSTRYPRHLEGKQFETDVISRKLLEVLG